MQIQGAGPVALFVVECESNGTYRATVKLRAGAHVPHDASLNDLVNQDDARTLRGDPGAAAGRCAPRTTQHCGPRVHPSRADRCLTRAIVPFEGDTVAEVLERYMERSEQIPTQLWLAADDHAAFGLLLQRMPQQGWQAAGGLRRGRLAAGHDAGPDPDPRGDAAAAGRGDPAAAVLGMPDDAAGAAKAELSPAPARATRSARC